MHSTTILLLFFSSSVFNVQSFTPVLPVGTITRRSRGHFSFTNLKVHQTPSIPITVTGNNIELTPALNDYINRKLDNIIGKLSASGAVQDCDVHLTVNKNPKVKNGHKAEVVTSVKGTTIRCAEESPDMYASIDAVTDRLKRKLRQYKERRLDGYHGGPHMGSNLAQALDEMTNQWEDTSPSNSSPVSAAKNEEEFVDPEAPVITKIKSYDLSKGISVEEAIFALNYVDHDFYVFRDAATNEINVIYKRTAGGYGLIQPQAP